MDDATASGTPVGDTKRTVPLTTGLAVALLIVQAVAMSSITLGPLAEHAVGHAVMGLPFALLLVLVLTVWPAPPPTRLGRTGRVVLIAGLAAVGGGSLGEAVGALGYADPGSVEVLQRVHNIGVLVTIAGIPTLFLGVVLSIAAAAVWRGWVRRKRFWGAVAALIVLVAAYLAGAMIFGFY